LRSRRRSSGANVGGAVAAIRRPRREQILMSPRLAAICVGIGALTAGLGYAAVAPYFEARQEPPTREAVVGAARFVPLSGYLRPQSRAGGRLERLDLAAYFPDFTPAGEARDVDVKTDLSERYDKLVFIEIKPAEPGLDPAERTAKLYARFLETEQWSHPGGLVAAAFQAGSPFEGQELYFVAPAGRVFAAVCGRPNQERKTPNACAYDFRLGDLDVELRFSAALLSEWEKLSAGARGLIAAARR
jgi:hypothetical protein